MVDIEQIREFFEAFASHWIWLSIALVAVGFSLWENVWGGIGARVALGVFAIFCFIGALVATISDQYDEMADVYDAVRESVGKIPRRHTPSSENTE